MQPRETRAHRIHVMLARYPFLNDTARVNCLARTIWEGQFTYLSHYAVTYQNATCTHMSSSQC